MGSDRREVTQRGHRRHPELSDNPELGRHQQHQLTSLTSGAGAGDSELSIVTQSGT